MPMNLLLKPNLVCVLKDGRTTHLMLDQVAHHIQTNPHFGRARKEEFASAGTINQQTPYSNRIWFAGGFPCYKHWGFPCHV